MPDPDSSAQPLPPLDLLRLDLRATNLRLASGLEALGQKASGPATPEEIGALLSELLRAGDWLRNRLPAEPERSHELQLELDAYQHNVECLRDLLPSMLNRLLAERARLEAERARVKSASEWAHASRQTL